MSPNKKMGDKKEKNVVKNTKRGKRNRREACGNKILLFCGIFITYYS